MIQQLSELLSFRENYLFWTDVSQHKIFAARPDGTSVLELVNTDLTVPGILMLLVCNIVCCILRIVYISDGLAWDWVNYKLYWTDAQDQDIEVLDPRVGHGHRKVLISTGSASQPRAIVVDPANRYMKCEAIYIDVLP